jgi:hypothetical protein
MLLHCPVTRAVMAPSGHATSRTDALRSISPRHALCVLALLLAIAPGGEAAAAATPVDPPAAGSDLPVGEPAPPAEPGRRRAVFVCQNGGAPVFSDRPCGSVVGQRALAVDAPASGAAPSTVPPKPRASTRPRPQPAGGTGTGRTAATRCSTLQRQLDELDDRMRAGYTSREAARLWNRWRELKDRLRTERC